ncbi:MAG: DUF1822 family protein [Alkalinema sp. RU_4_3]|nr:DUF1822 family protein [Alkalinema sp. RU_4_3]
MRDVAWRSARRHPSREKQGEVFRNLLAVQAVETFLIRMGVKTGRGSDSYDLAAQLSLDVADLEILGVGRLECRPVNPKAVHCDVPMETWNDRLGYVAVAIEETQATLLGFLPEVQAQQVLLDRFEPLTNLFEALVVKENSLSDWLVGNARDRWIDLKQWKPQGNPLAAFCHTPVVERPVEQIVTAINQAQDDEALWSESDRLWQIAPEHPQAGVRRVLDLGLALEGNGIALVVGVLPKEDDGEVAVLLRIAPLQQVYLPQGLTLAGLYPDGNAFARVQARESDNLIQLKFQANLGEKFSVQVMLGDCSITEHFTA